MRDLDESMFCYLKGYLHIQSDLKRQGETERKTEMDKGEKMTFHHIVRSLFVPLANHSRERTMSWCFIFGLQLFRITPMHIKILNHLKNVIKNYLISII